MKKQILIIPLALIVLLGFSCTKRKINRQIHGLWTATSVSVNGSSADLDQKYYSDDSLDFALIRNIRFYIVKKEELDPNSNKKTKLYSGYFSGQEIQKNGIVDPTTQTYYGSDSLNTLTSGVIYQFNYEIEKKNKIKFDINYGANPMVKNMPKEIEADLDFKKDNMTLDFTVNDDKYSFKFKRETDN